MKGWGGSHPNGAVFFTSNVHSENLRQILQMLKMTVAMVEEVTMKVVTTATTRNQSLERRREVWADKKRKLQTIYGSMPSYVVPPKKDQVVLFCRKEHHGLKINDEESSLQLLKSKHVKRPSASNHVQAQNSIHQLALL